MADRSGVGVGVVIGRGWHRNPRLEPLLLADMRATGPDRHRRPGIAARALVLGLAAVLLGPATASGADLVVDGRGWGHGVGLSQYGAYGFALREGRDHRSILAHYYAGSGYDSAPATRVRVRLKRARAPRLSGATRARAADRRRIRLRSGRAYRFEALGRNRVRVVDLVSGRTRARLVAPVNVTGGSSTVLHGPAENGVSGGRYRGLMVLSRDRRAVLAVNHVWLEHYLYGVVPAEMPASWPTEALRAQAVVARSYALASLRRGAPYDVFADVRSQVYRGLLGEVDATTDAVRATNARVVTVRGPGRADVLLLHLGRPHRDQRGGVRRHAAVLPALGRRPARRPVGLPHLDGPVHAPRRGAPAAVRAVRPVAGPRGRFAHAVGAGRDGRGAWEWREPGR